MAVGTEQVAVELFGHAKDLLRAVRQTSSWPSSAATQARKHMR